MSTESDSHDNKLSSSAEKKAAMYYASCLDVNQTLATLGSAPLVDLLWDTFGGWTVAPDPNGKISFNESAWDFQRSLEQIHSLGVYGFFSVWVAEDDKMPTRNILQVYYPVYCSSSR